MAIARYNAVSALRPLKVRDRTKMIAKNPLAKKSSARLSQASRTAIGSSGLFRASTLR